MSQLTNEQIEAAAKEGYSAADNQFHKSGIAHQYSMKQTPWNDLAEVTKDMWRVGVRYAAPFLQIPWDEPTKEEHIEFGNHVAATLERFPYGPMNIKTDDALTWFIAKRNAALIPNPVDPRREKIAKALCRTSMVGMGFDAIADRILAELDAKE